MIVKIRFPKKLAKNVTFVRNSAMKLLQILDLNIAFREKCHFSAENERKLQEIVTITSTPGAASENFVSGSNPITLSYNSSAVIIYNATHTMARFQN
jgi:hypothetical protein